MEIKKRVSAMTVALLFMVGMFFSGWGQSEAKAAAVKYPEKEVTLICPWNPGASADIQARALAKAASKYLKKPMVVVNQDGAGGIVATTQMKSAKPDGYTMALGVIGLFTTQPILNKSLGYKQSDFDFLLSITSAPCSIVVNANSPWKTLDDLVKDAKATNKTINYGTSGANTTPQLAGAQFFQMAGVKNQHIPFTGGAPAMTALLGNKVDACAVVVSDAIPQIKAGTMRALALASEKRMPTLPDVPTMKEKGYDYALTVRWYVFAPKGLSAEVKNILVDTLQKAVADPEFKKAAEDLYIAVDVMSAEETVNNFNAQIPILQKLISSPPQK